MSERVPDYAQGFKDGFAAGLEEGKKLANPQPDLNKLTIPSYPGPYVPMTPAIPTWYQTYPNVAYDMTKPISGTAGLDIYGNTDDSNK